MSLPDLNLGFILAAALPILVVLYLMIGRNWGGSKAGPAGWFAAIIVALLVFGANVQLLLVSFGRSLLLAFFVLYIIWMAILLFHVVNEAGAISVIGYRLPGLAQDKPGQALLLGWVFGSFLQGASGFGVPAAVVAPLLVGLGLTPNSAVVIALVGHAWAVTYGSLGSSFFSLMASTGEAGSTFAGSSAILLGLACLLCGLAVLWETEGPTAVRRRWGFLLVIGLFMAGTQYVLAVMGLWSLAAFGAGLVGLVVAITELRFGVARALGRVYHNLKLSSRNPTGPDSDTVETTDEVKLDTAGHFERQPVRSVESASLVRAVMPYLVLIMIVVSGQLIWKDELAVININPTFPAVSTSFGWHIPAGPGRSISVFGHAGALLFYTSILSFLWFRWRGPFQDGHSYRVRQILLKTVSGSTRPTIGIFSLVAMAVTMQHTGMTQLLALALSRGAGPVYPLISPFIGALGAFMTGSNTNSNVVFGLLQLETALAVGAPVTLILAAQTAGGAIGSLFAPAKVIVGCSTVPGAQDNQVLKRATIYGLVIVGVLGLLVLFAEILSI